MNVREAFTALRTGATPAAEAALMQVTPMTPPIRTAVLLAAGRGTRLRALTDTVPKCLVPVAGRTILGRLMDALSDAGFQRVVVATGYRARQIEDTMRAHGGLEVAFVHVTDYAATNNVVSLEHALRHRWCTAPQEPGVLVLEADLILGADALALMRVPDRVAVARFDTEHMDGTVLSLDATARVQAFHVGGPPEAPIPADGWWKTVNATALSSASMAPVRRTLRALVSAGRTDVYYETAFASLVADRTITLGAISLEGFPWFEIDTAEDLARVEGVLAPVATSRFAQRSVAHPPPAVAPQHTAGTPTPHA